MLGRPHGIYLTTLKNSSQKRPAHVPRKKQLFTHTTTWSYGQNIKLDGEEKAGGVNPLLIEASLATYLARLHHSTVGPTTLQLGIIYRSQGSMAHSELGTTMPPQQFIMFMDRAEIQTSNSKLETMVLRQKMVYCPVSLYRSDRPKRRSLSISEL